MEITLHLSFCPPNIRAKLIPILNNHMNSKEKAKFRQTSKWKNWCKYLKAKRGLVCECCGTHTKRLSVHHIDEKNYTVLKEDRFALLCNMCHKCVTRLERINPENYVKYNADWVAFYVRFLTPGTK